MSRKAAVLSSSGWVAILAACSNPPAPDSEPGQSAAAQPAREWRDPIVATTLDLSSMPRLARLTGSFQIIDGCLSFVRGEQTYVPVFNREALPVVGPSGLTWGGRELRYGQDYMMGGGSAPQSLDINEDARRNCQGPLLVISYFSG